MKKLQYNSPVILTFFLLSLGVLVLDWITGGWTTLHAFCVYRSSMADPLFYVRLFGHVLGHAGFDHFLGNMLLLLVIGPPLEEKYGSRTLLIGILLTAGVSGVLQCVFFPGSAPDWPMPWKAKIRLFSAVRLRPSVFPSSGWTLLRYSALPPQERPFPPCGRAGSRRSAR